MPKQEFPFPMPNGWFCITRCGEIKKGEVKGIKFCEKQVAVFRTESGKISVLDAYCAFNGIDLSKNGSSFSFAIVSRKFTVFLGLNFSTNLSNVT